MPTPIWPSADLPGRQALSDDDDVTIVMRAGDSPAHRVQCLRQAVCVASAEPGHARDHELAVRPVPELGHDRVVDGGPAG